MHAHARNSTPLPHHVPSIALTSVSSVSAPGTVTSTTFDIPGTSYIDRNERAGLPGRSAEQESTRRVTSFLSTNSKTQNVFRGLKNRPSGARERNPTSMQPISELGEEVKKESKRESKATTVRGGGMLMEPEPVLFEEMKAPTGGGQAGMLSMLLQYYDSRREDGLPMDSHGHREYLVYFLSEHLVLIVLI